MANVIKLKRGSGSDPQASDLVVGELCIRTDNGKLFTKKDSGAVSEISAGGNTFVINTLSQSNGTGGGSATFNGTAYRFTMSNPPSTTSAQCLVSINGVVQKPIANQNSQPAEGFTCYGNDIIFSSAPASGADFFIVTYISLAIGVPSDASVSEAKLNISNSGSNGQFLQKQSGNTGGLTWATVDLSSKLNLTGGTLTGDLTISGTQPALSFVDTNHNDDFKVYNNNGILKVYDMTNSVDRVAIHSNGDITVVNNLDVGQGLDVTGNITVTGTVDGVDIAARNTLFGGLTSSSGVLTNGVTATTQSASDNSTKVATTAYTDTAISNLIDSSPSALNTLNELAAALGDDANFSTTVTNSIATKAVLSGSTNNTICTVTGANAITGEANLTFDGSTLSVTGSNHVTQVFKAGGSSSDLTIDFKDSSNNLEARIFCASDQGDLRFQTGGSTERLRINSSGRLKINHNQQSGQLDETWLSIFDANSGANNAAHDQAGVSRNYSMINLHNYGSGSPGDTAGIGFGAGSSFAYTKGSIGFERTDGYGRGALVFCTNNDADTTLVNNTDERLRITQDGKIGIGEDDPDGNYLLIRAASTAGTNKGHIMLTGDSATNGQGPQIVFSESGSGSSFAGAYVGHVREGSNSTGALIFGTRETSGDANTVPTERLRINSSGNLGIGTNSPTDLVHLLKSHNGHTRLVVQNNWGSNATAQLKLVSPTDEFAIVKYASGDAYQNLSNSGNIVFQISGNEKLRLNSDGDLLPGADNTQDLGSTSKRWANVYCGDMNLSNKDSKNCVDSTWGEWVIQEGEEDLYLINKRKNKAYKFQLELVKDLNGSSNVKDILDGPPSKDQLPVGDPN